MALPHRPKAVVFDVVETLISLAPLRSRFADIGLAAELAERWFDRLLRDGIALSLAGDYQPFPVVAAAALRTLARDELDEDAVGHVMAGFGALPPPPDAEPAMRTLADSGISLACLSNGTAEATMDFLNRSSLGRYVDQVISVAEVRSWKPASPVYTHAAGVIGHRPEELALVAVHAFDCHGAKRAGWTTGWAGRTDGHYAEVFAPADVVGTDLVDVATKLLALSAHA
ncbi:haloacid dehalogenase, type II [Mycobacterium persicum]|nr:haloacid dehalogenase, type II [Mycobacterium persicum]